MSFYTRIFCVFTGAALAAACGGSDEVDPEIVPGGGIADPDIDGEVHVFVIDEDTDEPIEGAEVTVGDTTGETDADGLISVSDVDGPVTITVVEDGYTSATWVGVDGANVTIPLSSTEGRELQQGTVSGMIDGWEDLPDPPAGKVGIAIVQYSANQEDEDPANDIPQPMDPSPNVCGNPGGAGDPPPCEWTVRTRTGQMAIYAFLGTIDADANIEVTGFAYASGVQVDDGEDVDGVSLTIADDDEIVFPDVSLPSAPSGTDAVAAAVRLDLGDDGRLVVPVAGAGLPFELPVPDLALFPDATYELVGFAAAAEGGAASISIERDLESVEELSVGRFLPVPTNISTDGTTFSFDAVDDATLHIFGVADAAYGTSAWGGAIFDGSTEVVIPDQVTLPEGGLSFSVQAIEIPGLDLQDFALDDITDLVTRVASDAVSFTN